MNRVYMPLKIVIFIHAVLVVGFETVSSHVDEEIGSFVLCVRIFTEAALLPMYTNFSFSLSLVSVPGTAGIYVIPLLVTNLPTSIQHNFF